MQGIVRARLCKSGSPRYGRIVGSNPAGRSRPSHGLEHQRAQHDVKAALRERQRLRDAWRWL